jgi:hypothetical protein
LMRLCSVTHGDVNSFSYATAALGPEVWEYETSPA